MSRRIRTIEFSYSEATLQRARQILEAKGGCAATALSDVEFDRKLSAELLRETQSKWRARLPLNGSRR
jgi:hypothetical protein